MYDAIYFAGGHGAVWDLPDATRIIEMTATIFERGGIVVGRLPRTGALHHRAESRFHRRGREGDGGGAFPLCAIAFL